MNGTLIPPMPSEPAAPLPSNGLEDSSSKAGPAAQEAGPARPKKKKRKPASAPKRRLPVRPNRPGSPLRENLDDTGTGSGGA